MSPRDKREGKKIIFEYFGLMREMEQAATGEETMTRVHDIKKVSFAGDTMKILVDGKNHSFSLADISKRLL